MPSSRAARATRTAISPRLAMRIFSSTPANVGSGQCPQSMVRRVAPSPRPHVAGCVASRMVRRARRRDRKHERRLAGVLTLPSRVEIILLQMQPGREAVVVLRQHASRQMSRRANRIQEPSRRDEIPLKQLVVNGLCEHRIIPVARALRVAHLEDASHSGAASLRVAFIPGEHRLSIVMHPAHGRLVQARRHQALENFETAARGGNIALPQLVGLPERHRHDLLKQSDPASKAIDVGHPLLRLCATRGSPDKTARKGVCCLQGHGIGQSGEVLWRIERALSEPVIELAQVTHLCDGRRGCTAPRRDRSSTVVSRCESRQCVGEQCGRFNRRERHARDGEPVVEPGSLLSFAPPVFA